MNLINYLIKGIGGILSWLLGLFPDSPFLNPNTPPDSVNLGYITWLIDFPTMLVHFIGVCSAILGYYLIRVLARWVKVVRS